MVQILAEKIIIVVENLLSKVGRYYGKRQETVQEEKKEDK